MPCGCYNSNNFFLPWAYHEDLTVHANEYNLFDVVNRSSFRLLENDLALERNYLCLEVCMGCCDLAYSLYSTVSANSAEWSQVNNATDKSVWSHYNATPRHRIVPTWGTSLTGEVLSGLAVDAGSLSPSDGAVPTTRCAYNALRNAINPEFIQYIGTSTGTPADPPLVVWYGQNAIRESVFKLSELVFDCTAGDHVAQTWPLAPPNLAYFCGPMVADVTPPITPNGKVLTLKSIKEHVQGFGSSYYSMLECRTSTTNALLDIPLLPTAQDSPFELFANIYVETAFSDVYLYTGNPTLKLKQDAFLRRIFDGVTLKQAGTVVTLKSDSALVLWKLEEGRITYAGTEYAAPPTVTFELNASLTHDTVDVQLNGACNKVSTELKTFTVTFVAGPCGTITGDNPQVVIPHGNCTAVSAVKNAGCKFVNWTTPDSCSSVPFPSTNNPLTVTDVVCDMTVTANFFDCCDAGIGDMMVVDAFGNVPDTECPLEVSPKAGCP